MKSAQSFAAPRKMSASALLLLGLVLAFGCTQPLPQKAQFAQVDVVTANDVPQPGADADATGVDAAPDTAQPDTLGADSPDTVDAADTIDAEPDAGPRRLPPDGVASREEDRQQPVWRGSQVNRD